MGCAWEISRKIFCLFWTAMEWVSGKKYKELELAIKNREFPIIVYGPSGSGKTYTILRVLESLGLKHSYVELSSHTVTRTLQRQCVTLAYLYSTSDLSRVVHPDNLIIETTLPHVNKLKGYKLVKFNRISAQRARVHGIEDFNGNLFSLGFPRQPDYTLEFYRFLGRIFYKKLKISDVRIEDGMVYLSLNDLAGEECKGKQPQCHRTSKHARSSSLSGSDLAREEHKGKQPQCHRTSKPVQYAKSSSLSGGSPRCVQSVHSSTHRALGSARGKTEEPTAHTPVQKRRSLVLESSSEPTCSFDDEEVSLGDTSVDEIESALRLESSEGGCSDSLEESGIEGTRIEVSFDRGKVMHYLYENLVDFCRGGGAGEVH